MEFDSKGHTGINVTRSMNLLHDLPSLGPPGNSSSKVWSLTPPSLYLNLHPKQVPGEDETKLAEQQQQRRGTEITLQTFTAVASSKEKVKAQELSMGVAPEAVISVGVGAKRPAAGDARPATQASKPKLVLQPPLPPTGIHRPGLPRPAGGSAKEGGATSISLARKPAPGGPVSASRSFLGGQRK